MRRVMPAALILLLGACSSTGRQDELPLLLPPPPAPVTNVANVPYDPCLPPVFADRLGNGVSTVSEKGLNITARNVDGKPVFYWWGTQIKADLSDREYKHLLQIILIQLDKRDGCSRAQRK